MLRYGERLDVGDTVVVVKSNTPANIGVRGRVLEFGNTPGMLRLIMRKEIWMNGSYEIVTYMDIDSVRVVDHRHELEIGSLLIYEDVWTTPGGTHSQNVKAEVVGVNEVCGEIFYVVRNLEGSRREIHEPVNARQVVWSDLWGQS